MDNIFTENDSVSRKLRTQISYETALRQHSSARGMSRVSWATWSITIGTVLVWCFTAYQVALAAGAHSLQGIIGNVMNNAVNIQDNDALTNVLIQYGAKENTSILHGQYWRFITPIFLHANLLHVGLNMLNLVILGIFLERLIGHWRFLFIYLLTGVVSIISSFYFMPQEVSVGASGAIFGLVGAYSIFVLIHRRAFRNGGIPTLLWLVIVIGGNLSVGLFIPNVDNYAHMGGLISGCFLGWWFTPLYTLSPHKALIDKHSLARRWPLALLTIIGVLMLAIMAVHFIGG